VARLRLFTESFPEDPALDMAVSRALLERVAAGELPDALRIARPGRAVAFGKRDVISPGYGAAVEAARGEGFEAIERLPGGRAAVFHEDTVSVAHAIHDEHPREGVTRRFEETARLMADAFERLGVDARVGEVAGEYCPGEHSVNARGERKLMGLGQRVVSGGAHLGAVVVVAAEQRVREVLTPVYSALGLAWSPEATGSLADEVPGIGWQGAVEAIEAEYAERYELQPAQLDDETLALARRLAPEHLSRPVAGAESA
jgi:octanoyl-[GcvH]:protein N-octanoyltransferase